MNIDRYLDAEWKDEHMGKRYLQAYNDDRLGLKDTPMLMVGIGGSGIEALLALKTKLESIYHADKLSKVEYLFIDTDEMPGNAGIKKADKIILQSADTAILLRERRNMDSLLPDEIKEWLHDEIEPIRIMNGAAGIRQAGRLILFLNIQHVYNVLVRKIDRIRENIELSKTRVPVYIFTGIGGGTGSGMFVDISYIIRHIIESTEINGIVFMPDVSCKKPGIRNVTKKNIQKNGCAALRELEYLMMTERYGERFEQRYPGDLGLVSTSAPIFDYCYLVGAETKSRKSVNPEQDIFLKTAEYVLQEIQEKYTDAHSIDSYKSNLVHNKKRSKPFFENYMSIGTDAKYIAIDYYYSWWLQDVLDKVMTKTSSADDGIFNLMLTEKLERWVEETYKNSKDNLRLKSKQVKIVTLHNVRTELEKTLTDEKEQGNSVLQDTTLMIYFLANAEKEELIEEVKDSLAHTAKKYKFLVFTTIKWMIANSFIEVFNELFETDLKLLQEDCKNFKKIIENLQGRCAKYEGLMQEECFLFKKEYFERLKEKEAYRNSIQLASDHIIKDFAQQRDRWLGRKTSYNEFMWLSEYVAKLLSDEFVKSECTSLTGLLRNCFDDGDQMQKERFKEILNSLNDANVLWPCKGNGKSDDAYERIAVAEDAELETWVNEWASDQEQEAVVVRSNIKERFAKVRLEADNALHFFNAMKEYEKEYLENRSEAGLHLYGKAPKDWSKLPAPYNDKDWNCGDAVVSQEVEAENDQYRKKFDEAVRDNKIYFDNGRYYFEMKMINGKREVVSKGAGGDKHPIGDILSSNNMSPTSAYTETAKNMFIRMFSIRDLF